MSPPLLELQGSSPETRSGWLGSHSCLVPEPGLVLGVPVLVWLLIVGGCHLSGQTRPHWEALLTAAHHGLVHRVAQMGMPCSLAWKLPCRLGAALEADLALQPLSKAAWQVTEPLTKPQVPVCRSGPLVPCLTGKLC